jgi:hypothetical protein
MWAATVLLAVAAAVVGEPIRELHDVLVEGGWLIRFPDPPAGYPLLVPLVRFVGVWVGNTLSVGVLPVVAVVTLRVVAWRRRPGQIGLLYVAVIALVGACAAFIMLLLGDVPWPWLAAPGCVLMGLVGTGWSAAPLGRRGEGNGDPPVGTSVECRYG